MATLIISDEFLVQLIQLLEEENIKLLFPAESLLSYLLSVLWSKGYEPTNQYEEKDYQRWKQLNP